MEKSGGLGAAGRRGQALRPGLAGDHERFSGERKGMIADLVGENLRLNPIEIDPPEHHGYRRNLNPQFTPRAVTGWNLRCAIPAQG